ncbi:hypothetical protein BGI32_06865 [Snodgrassella alvi]|uniref:Uncharacterized protein n=1 Tax=Snodgrassella alvi TaxID=1196083 RepID=A0A2N9WTG6_9NEIS|nr:hypothetical protein BGI32_06865 [Snodgrassella alvi]
MVVLGSTDGLFTGSSAVFVVAVVVPSEMQELVTANQVVVAVVFSVFAVQQVGSGIVLQGLPVSLVSAAFDSTSVIIAVIGLPVFAVFFAYRLVARFLPVIYLCHFSLYIIHIIITKLIIKFFRNYMPNIS